MSERQKRSQLVPVSAMSVGAMGPAVLSFERFRLVVTQELFGLFFGVA